MHWKSLGSAVRLSALAHSNTVVSGKADLVLHDADVLGHPNSDSVAIAGGVIAAHGKFDDIKGLVGPRTHMLKLGGRTLAPGFIDAHLHYLEASSVASGVNLSKARALGELLLELRAAAGRTAPGNWLRAFGCDEALLLEQRGPTRKEIDEAVPRNPLRLRHQTLHASWLNSRAINALGLEREDFVPPPGAHIVRDSGGRLTGLVVGMETWLTRRLPPVTSADLEARARIFSRELAACGVTGFTDATVRNGLDEIKLFARLIGAGAICQHTSLMLGAHHLDSSVEAREAAASAGSRVVAIKFMNPTAIDASELPRLMIKAAREGLDCAFHVTEVDELDAALEAIEAVARHYGAKVPIPVRMRIEHGGTIPPNYLDRLAEVSAWIVTNPGFIYYRGAKYLAESGLVPHLYRIRSLLQAGIRLAGGTDAPVTPARPFVAVAAAVARMTRDGATLAQSECVNTTEALALFTSAAGALAEINAGEIAPGRLADMIVLPSNPLDLDPGRLMNLQVDSTIVGGRIVYERGRPEVGSGSNFDRTH